jgi:hypothetical protein
MTPTEAKILTALQSKIKALENQNLVLNMRVQRLENVLLEKFSGIFAGEDGLTQADPELNPIDLTDKENGNGQRTDEQLGSGNREASSAGG